MKSYVVLLVTAMMLIKPLWPIAEYIANYDYITNVLCENRDKPQLQCNGKCYLSKQLAKEAEQNDQNPFGERFFIEMLQTVFFEPLTTLSIEYSVKSDSKNKIVYLHNFFSSRHLLVLIQPPENCLPTSF
ncbi:hypothetical protein [Allomuricauda sp. SCSIO 65647]|uniref:hypothetical protein n=1 Tax=Allomuricauda sp. SCSIO 65647 TaxID=2908843 RepID=UPI001F196AC7|nr:hypothetical protein [Muricauda sp. SCSIO 65647]UJH68468.1 hypothetical protein L0P89_04480 [Muricauda sp. SCSIO 65647]